MTDGADRDTQIALARQKELDEYHARMVKLVGPAAEFAELLATVKAKRLHLLEYDSWRAYVTGQWGHSYRWADPLIRSHQAVALPEPPKDEQQADKPGVPFGEPVKLEMPADAADVAKAATAVAERLVEAVADPVVVALADAKAVFGDAIRHAHLLLRKVRAIVEAPHGQFLAYEELRTHVRNTVAGLKHAQPIAPCPYCDQGRRLKKCKHCKGRHYVNKFLNDAAPEDLRK